MVDGQILFAVRRVLGTSIEELCNMKNSSSKAAETDLTKKIGQRLRSARHAQGLSLSELSARTGTLSKSRISNYEQGIRRMGLEEAQELSQALGTVTPIYLLCLDDTDPLSEEERRLVESYRYADERGREMILRVAESQTDYRTEGEQTGDDQSTEA